MFNESPKRRFLWLPVALGVGIGVYFSLPFEPKQIFVYAILSIAFTGFLGNAYTLKSYGLHSAAFLIFGFCLAFWRTHQLETYRVDDFLKDITMQGTLLDVEDKENFVRFVLHNLVFKNGTNAYPDVSWDRIKKVRLKVNKSLLKAHNHDLSPGIMVILKATLFPFQGAIYTNGLDLKRHAYFEGLSAQGSVKNIIEISLPPQADLQEKLSYYRALLTQTLTQKLPKDTSGIAAALITGDRSFISKDVRQNFVDAGIAHILAISGLHLSIIAGFVFFLLRGSLALIPPVVERFPIKKISAFSVIVMTFCYLLISGSGYPVQRAFMMTSLAMIAIILDRQALSMRLLAFAAFAILIIKPESLLSASFQLSFAAVTALIAFYESGWKTLYEWSRYGNLIHKGFSYVTGIVITTIIATLATTPFTIFFFNRFTLQAVIGNVLAIPLTGILVMPSAFLATTSLLWGGSEWILSVFDMNLRLLRGIASFTASLPGAAILIPSPPLWALLLCVAGGLWLCLWHTKIRYMGIVGIIGGFVGFSINPTPDILISKNVIAYKRDDTLFVSGEKGWFEQDIWQKHLGLKKREVWKKPIVQWGSIVLIDNNLRRPSQKTMDNLCGDTTLTAYITTGYLPKQCEATLHRRGIRLIHRGNLKQDIYGIWLSDGSIKIITPKYTRPWA